MKNLFLGICLVGWMAVSGFTQTPVPQQTPNQNEILQQQMIERQRQQRESERRQMLEEFERRARETPANKEIYADPLLLYRKSTAKELKLLAPKAEDLTKYAAFLRQPNTGIIKLAADKGCSDNSKVVTATPDCLVYTMPGAGSSYSFRVKDYRISRLADITFTQNSFQAIGVRLHGIFAELGDVPLEQVNLQTKGLEFPVSFKAEPDFEKAKELDRQLIKGISDKGFLYSRAIEAKDNTTYVLRSIAYRGKYLRASQKAVYNELDFDERKDVIIAFRIVRRDDDGAVTILWKQLAQQDSPKTKINKDEEAKQNKNSNFTARN